MTRAAPPCFIIHTADDASVNLSLGVFSALTAANVPAEMHIFDPGGARLRSAARSGHTRRCAA